MPMVRIGSLKDALGHELTRAEPHRLPISSLRPPCALRVSHSFGADRSEKFPATARLHVNEWVGGYSFSSQCYRPQFFSFSFPAPLLFPGHIPASSDAESTQGPAGATQSTAWKLHFSSSDNPAVHASVLEKGCSPAVRLRILRLNSGAKTDTESGRKS